MPSPLAHSVSGYILAKFLPLKQRKESRVNKWYMRSLYPVFVATCADCDFIPQIITGQVYHRGPTHSIFFTFVFSVVTGFVVSYWQKYSYRQIFLLTAIVYSSHLFLDFFTVGGKGMQLFWPVTDSFFKSPIAIFPGVHHSRGLWHYSHLIPFGFELAYSALLFTGFVYWKKSQKF
ncbi:MAG: metal-dependent hydrolase [Xenococcaceae cyanobacterium]